jgi:nucleoside-diphosphate-sugar epimerase
MKYLIVGATGATGKFLVSQLLEKGHEVRVIVRSKDRLPEYLRTHQDCEVVEGSLLDFDDEKLSELVKGCQGIGSCLGHNISFKGMYGNPQMLVTEAVRRLCLAAKSPIHFVLMNTTGNRNRDLNEPVSFAQKLVVDFIRLLVPPHKDNEKASDVLRLTYADSSMIEWVVVRPDGLINQDSVSEYELHPSPTRSAIFDAGKTSRINVAHFMATLLTDEELWGKWKNQMPVIYNKQ